MNPDRPVRHPAVETARFDAEAVLYDERTGVVHHLNGSASAIWLLLDGRPVDDLVRALAAATGVSPDELRPDVVATIEQFHAAGLLAG